MGLFDFLKKKGTSLKSSELHPSTQSTSEPIEETGNLTFIKTYGPHLIQFIRMQSQNNYAPIAAYEKNNGAVQGYLLVSEDSTYNQSIPEVINLMEGELERRLNNKTIKSYTIYYHSTFDGNKNHNIAETEQESKAISMRYFFNDKRETIALPYSFQENHISYGIITGFSPTENNFIYDIELQEGKDYFKDRINMTAPIRENKAGLKIKTVNQLDLENLWCGIFGFENYRNQGANTILNKLLADIRTDEPKAISGYEYREKVHPPLVFKSFSQNATPLIFLPKLDTDEIIPVENNQIDEWENASNSLAIITGKGRDTFAIRYFATDYLENKEHYHSGLALDLKMSGVVFILDVYMEDPPRDGVPSYSPDFCAYMPNSDMAHYACFDFIGELKRFQKVAYPTMNLTGYIITVKLINHPDHKNFFTIDLFVNQNNMRFAGLTAGMKLTGMFQLHGEMA